jgi:hypothetical protein
VSIGGGCTVHLRDGELPRGRLIVSVSKHVLAVIDGVCGTCRGKGRITMSDGVKYPWHQFIVDAFVASPARTTDKNKRKTSPEAFLSFASVMISRPVPMIRLTQIPTAY